jgi:hypothetical protein
MQFLIHIYILNVQQNKEYFLKAYWLHIMLASHLTIYSELNLRLDFGVQTPFLAKYHPF